MNIKTKDMILVALFAALTAVGAFISIPVGPVPISLQTMFVLFSGMILGSKLGALSQIVYLIIGLVGIPVFAGGNAGLAAVMRPSFGYAIGFILGAYICGKIVESRFSNNVFKFIIASLLGTLAIYLIGIPYLYFVLKIVSHKTLGFYTLMKTGLIIFIPGDLVKCVTASLISYKILPLMNKTNSKAF